MAVYQNLLLTEVSQDVLANSSKVRILWQSQQTGQSFNEYTNTAKYYISINGAPEQEYSVTYTLPQYTNATIVDVTLDVPHDDLGNGSVRVRTWMNTGISAGVVQLDKELELAPIARASTIVASDAYIGATAIIVVDQKSKSYTHSIHYEFGALSGYIADAAGTTSDAEKKITATNIGFPLPVSFYEQIAESPTGKCTLTCRTYSGDNLIGADQITSFTVNTREPDCCPIVDGTVRDCNPLTIELTRDPTTLINGFSTALCEITAEARYGAGLFHAAVNNLETYDTVEIYNVETGTFTFVASDTRGYQAAKSVQLPLIPYFPLSGVLTGQRKGPTSYEADISIKGAWYSGSFGAADNTLRVVYRIGTEECEMVVETDGDEFTASAVVPGLDYTKNHTIEVIVSDRIGSIEQSIVIKKGVPVFSWGENDFTFHVPVLFNASAKGLTDSIYPVGSIYLSTQDVSPGDLFGGKWERIRDTFLLAAGDTYPAGSQGGAAEHILTVEEMPAHSHNGAVKTYMEGHVEGDFSDVRMWGEENTQSLPLTDNAGGGMPHNNMPPYLAVYIWKRTE